MSDVLSNLVGVEVSYRKWMPEGSTPFKGKVCAVAVANGKVVLVVARDVPRHYNQQLDQVDAGDAMLTR
jgi:hypothetical protein